jgi:hypothetical protein
LSSPCCEEGASHPFDMAVAGAQKVSKSLRRAAVVLEIRHYAETLFGP